MSGRAGGPGADDGLERARARASSALASEPGHRREVIDARLVRWWPDLVAGLRGAFPEAQVPELLDRLVDRCCVAYAERDDELHRLDLRRTLDRGWFQHPGMLGYAAYAERFAGDLAGVGRRVDYLGELGVTYLHLMPLLLPRDGDSDGGYAVADFRTVRPDLGTVDDLRALAKTLRGNGISLVLDLVLNHVAREHAWARAARAGDARYRAYFHVFDDRTLPDAYEATLPEVFPDLAPGSFTYEPELRGWVWTTFKDFQWDLNWSNPDVLVEMVDVALFLAGCGVEVLRLDAIAFLVKRMGTDCQNQPEVHALTQVLRAVTRIACPALLIKAEAIVGPAQLAAYLGRGEHHGKVSDLAYHNGLMVQVWSMLATGEVTLAVQALRQMPAVPSSTAWITYVRCHDDIGWAVSDEDAAAVGRSGPAHRRFLADWYCGDFPSSTARGLVFGANAATGDRRISGTAADLVGLTAALAVGDPDAADSAVARLLLAHAIVLGWGGVPVVWSGDELGLVGDPRWAEEPGHGDDNRWVHRPRLPWDLAATRHDPSTTAGRVHSGLRHLAATRGGLEQLDASVAAQVLDPSDDGVLLVLRAHPVGPFLLVANVTSTWRPVPGERLRQVALPAAVDALTGAPAELDDDDRLWLQPYGVRWLVRP